VEQHWFKNIIDQYFKASSEAINSALGDSQLRIIQKIEYPNYYLSFLLAVCLSCHHSLSFAYKAVNLGNWLVAEGWMEPSRFDGIVNKDLLVSLVIFKKKIILYVSIFFSNYIILCVSFEMFDFLIIILVFIEEFY